MSTIGTGSGNFPDSQFAIQAVKAASQVGQGDLVETAKVPVSDETVLSDDLLKSLRCASAVRPHHGEKPRQPIRPYGEDVLMPSPASKEVEKKPRPEKIQVDSKHEIYQNPNGTVTTISRMESGFEVNKWPESAKAYWKNTVKRGDDEGLSQLGRSGVRILGATPEELEKMDDILSKLPRADRDAIQFVAMADENQATFVEGDNRVQVRNTSVEMSGMDPSDPKNRGQIVLIRSQFASPIGTAVFLEELGHAVDFAYGITADKTGPWGSPPFLNPQISDPIEDFAYSYMAFHGDKFQDSALQNMAEHIRTKMPEKFAAIEEHEKDPGEMMDNKIHGSGGPWFWWR